MSKHILVVDDDSLYHFLLGRMIEVVDPAIRVTQAYNGEAAIEQLEVLGKIGDKPDVILVDINMPVMDGWEFLKLSESFFEEYQVFPAIYMVSSSIDPRDAERCKRNKRVRGYVSKPFSFDLLGDMIYSRMEPGSTSLPKLRYGMNSQFT